MNIPCTYAEWVLLFDVLKEGNNDQEILSLMEKGSISWTSGVAERFSTKLFEVISRRLQTISNKFQRNLNNAMGNESAIINAILGVRRELVFVKKLTMIPAIPEDKRKYFRQPIEQYANNTQRSLEDSAKNDRTGRLGSVLRNNRVNNLDQL